MGDVRCGYCGAAAPAGAHYCPQCGASSEFLSRKKIPVQADSEPAIQSVKKEVHREKETIVLVCPSCGHENPPGNAFCGQCAHPLRDETRVY